MIILFCLIGLTIGYSLAHIVFREVDHYYTNEMRKVWGLEPHKKWQKRYSQG